MKTFFCKHLNHTLCLLLQSLGHKHEVDLILLSLTGCRVDSSIWVCLALQVNVNDSRLFPPEHSIGPHFHIRVVVITTVLQEMSHSRVSVSNLSATSVTLATVSQTLA